jgi:uncharacterized protein involved in cysteine biosynthesis
MTTVPANAFGDTPRAWVEVAATLLREARGTWYHPSWVPWIRYILTIIIIVITLVAFATGLSHVVPGLGV